MKSAAFSSCHHNTHLHFRPPKPGLPKPIPQQRHRNDAGSIFGRPPLPARDLAALIRHFPSSVRLTAAAAATQPPLAIGRLPHLRVLNRGRVAESMAAAVEPTKIKEEEEEEKRARAPPLPEPPEKPEPGDCCGSGCVRCVWDVYYEELEAYDKLVEEY